MRVSKLNDWLQLFASVGVIIGLLMVAYEIHQNSTIARAEAYVAIMDTWTSVTLKETDPELAETIAKSFNEGAELTDGELFQLSAWLQAIMQAYQEQMELEERLEMPGNIVDEFSNDVFYYFGTEFSRNWYAINRYWFNSTMTEIVDDYIADVEVGTTPSYLDQIRTAPDKR